MTSDNSLLNIEDREAVGHTMLVRGRLEEQFESLDQQHHAAELGMWVFLATEVMFFGTLFVGLNVYRSMYPIAFATASGQLNWLIGGINTVVLLVSSLTIVLAVQEAKLGNRDRVVLFLVLTALLGFVFLVFKGVEYFIDYREYLIPGWRFKPDVWVTDHGLRPDQVAHVKLFLLFYWIMTAFHALHVTIGIVAVLVMAVLARRNYFTSSYNSPIDVTALYWHFVDIVWIFLLPMLYLLSTHHITR